MNQTFCKSTGIGGVVVGERTSDPSLPASQSCAPLHRGCWSCGVGGSAQGELGGDLHLVSQWGLRDGGWVSAHLTHPYLHRSLENNDIGDAGAAAVAEALKVNSAVTEIE